MYFLPRSSKFNAWIVTIKPFHLYLYTSIVLSLLVLLWFFTLYSKLDFMIAQQHARIKQSQDQSLQTVKTQGDYDLLALSVKEKQSALHEYTSSHSTDHQLHAAMLFLINQANISGVTLQSCSVDQQTDKGWYIQNIINLDAHGPYDALLNFFASFITCEHLIAAKQFNLLANADGKFSIRSKLDVMVVR